MLSPSTGLSTPHDPRDRTHEFFHTVSTLEKQLILTTGLIPTNHASNASANANSNANANAFRRLATNGHHHPHNSSSSSSSFVANEFDSRMDDPRSALLTNGSSSTATATASSTSSSSSSSSSSHQPSLFTLSAREISHSLLALSEKLERLGHMAKQQSLFNDPVEEFNELTAAIKAHLTDVDRDIAALHRHAQMAQDERDESTGELRRKTAHSMHHSSTIVRNLSQQLANATKTFQHVLEVRTKNLKELNSRRREFDSSSLQMLKRRNNPFESAMAAAAASSSSSTAAATIDLEPPTADDPDPSHHLQLQQQQQQLVQTDPHVVDEYYSDRVGAVERIESTIHELGSMYQRLVELVQTQGEVALRIDANLDDTLVNVEAGHNQLLTYYDRMSGNTTLILKVFAILIAFLVFFMLFVA